jgi:hypothetical protein
VRVQAGCLPGRISFPWYVRPGGARSQGRVGVGMMAAPPPPLSQQVILSDAASQPARQAGHADRRFSTPQNRLVYHDGSMRIDQFCSQHGRPEVLHRALQSFAWMRQSRPGSPLGNRCFRRRARFRYRTTISHDQRPCDPARQLSSVRPDRSLCSSWKRTVIVCARGR